MTECNGCGACCEPFQTVFAPNHFALHPDAFDPDELVFYREHLTPMKRRDGRRMTWWSTGWSEMIIDGHAQLLAAHYYKCDRYDTETRQCTDYANRPDVCRKFPWYDEPPDPNKVLPPTCSFNADIGRDVVPLEVAVELGAKMAGRSRARPHGA
jgi:Fe-S-cluster containining protein